MANTSEIKNGLCINFSNDVYKVIEFLHVKPGKGPAFVRCKLKSLTNGKVVDNTWPSSHKIDIVRVERKKFQYLYNDDSGYHFMDHETYDQVAISGDIIDNVQFMKEGMDVEVLYNAETNSPLTIDLPQYINLEVTKTEPGVKGNTATNASKPAIVETGAEIKVPIFINENDLVKIEVKTGNYIERVKV